MAGPMTSKLHRALPASVFLVLSASCFLLMDIPAMVYDYPSPSATGFISWSNKKVPILQEFHWISSLDKVFRDVTVGFAPSSFGYDDVSRWQMLNFMQDIGVLYLVWLCESTRAGNRWSVVYFPAIFNTIAQLGGGGVIIPLYYFLFIVFCPPTRVQTLADRRITLGDALLWMLLTVLFHTLPGMAIYFAPDFETQHYWTWFWQLYPVRMSIVYFLVEGVSKILPIPRPRIVLRYSTTIRLILFPMIAISTGVWIYTLLNCPYSLKTIFCPAPLIEDTWLLRMRRILQFDELFVYGSSMVWLGFLMMDAKKAGLVSGSGIAGFLVMAVGLTGIVGPGATFGVMWLWREGYLVDEEKDGEGLKRS
ncbi:hypothetical protein K469DRAFT_664532 [Zopfia rhizophila CBS 207.26]|uniref:Uncharacterized protein n=1 Tax=Zopfia rhizophila CBS 207.26 TaxID=1314779 RepID=A0A6A6E7A6_9PEZI|nr:hypothetical protein K469DRAFT_664532 [Zopfia rhizophila CBS 207.26]